MDGHLSEPCDRLRRDPHRDAATAPGDTPEARGRYATLAEGAFQVLHAPGRPLV